MVNTAELAKRHNGFATWTFSQKALNVLRYTAFGSSTRWGVCAALATQWIMYHADGGSLVNELGGGGVSKLNTKKLKEIIAQHALFSGKGGDYQSEQLRLWLENNGIVEVKTACGRRSTAYRRCGWKTTA